MEFIDISRALWNTVKARYYVKKRKFGAEAQRPLFCVHTPTAFLERQIVVCRGSLLPLHFLKGFDSKICLRGFSLTAAFFNGQFIIPLSFQNSFFLGSF